LFERFAAASPPVHRMTRQAVRHNRSCGASLTVHQAGTTTEGESVQSAKITKKVNTTKEADDGSKASGHLEWSEDGTAVLSPQALFRVRVNGKTSSRFCRDSTGTWNRCLLGGQSAFELLVDEVFAGLLQPGLELLAFIQLCQIVLGKVLSHIRL